MRVAKVGCQSGNLCSRVAPFRVPATEPFARKGMPNIVYSRARGELGPPERCPRALKDVADGRIAEGAAGIIDEERGANRMWTIAIASARIDAERVDCCGVERNNTCLAELGLAPPSERHVEGRHPCGRGARLPRFGLRSLRVSRRALRMCEVANRRSVSAAPSHVAARRSAGWCRCDAKGGAATGPSADEEGLHSSRRSPPGSSRTAAARQGGVAESSVHACLVAWPSVPQDRWLPARGARQRRRNARTSEAAPRRF